MENIVYVNTQELLLECASSLDGVKILGLDTETTGLAEKPDTRISLIQISKGEGDAAQAWVIDCLCGLDLRPIRDLVFNPDICKVIHFADFDVAILRKCLNWSIRNVWCTYTAEKRTGKRGLKLKDLVEHYYGIELDKSFQDSDWKARPLSPEQLRYAGLDAIMTLRIFHDQHHLGLNGSYDKAAQAMFPEVGLASALSSKRKAHPSSFTKLEWDAETTELIDWFATAKLPSTPFTLMKGHQIVDPARWYSSLRQDIAAGAGVPRGQTGALKMDLAVLKSMLEKDSYA